MRRAAVVLALLAGCGPYSGRTTARGSLDEPTLTFVDEAAERERGSPPELEPGAVAAIYGREVTPELEALIAESLAANPDVLAALASIEESRALALQVRAARMPTASLVFAGSLTHTISGGIGAFDARTLSVTVPLAYEVDLTGRYAREHAAAELDAVAEAHDARAATRALAAEVADAYVGLVAARVTLTLVTSQRARQEHLLELVTRRVAEGLAPGLERREQEQRVLAFDTRLAATRDAERSAALRLSLVLGRSLAPYGDVAAELPVPPEVERPSVGVDDLEGRPDVEAALARLEATDARVAAAFRAQMPQLRIAFTPGYTVVESESSRGQSSARGFTYNLTGTLTVPLFDGLRQASIVRQRRAEVDRRLFELERVLRVALVEAASAIDSERERRVMLEAARARLALATSIREEAERAYAEGLVSYVQVVLAFVEEESAALDELAARLALLDARVRVLRALAP